MSISQGAFPSKLAGTPYEGMTLRDYFAGQALVSGLISSYSRLPEDSGNASIARDCYSIADAMMEARKT